MYCAYVMLITVPHEDLNLNVFQTKTRFSSSSRIISSYIALARLPAPEYAPGSNLGRAMVALQKL